MTLISPNLLLTPYRVESEGESLFFAVSDDFVYVLKCPFTGPEAFGSEDTFLKVDPTTGVNAETFLLDRAMAEDVRQRFTQGDVLTTLQRRKLLHY
jgi:hypothetical protein